METVSTVVTKAANGSAVSQVASVAQPQSKSGSRDVSVSQPESDAVRVELTASQVRDRRAPVTTSEGADRSQDERSATRDQTEREEQEFSDRQLEDSRRRLEKAINSTEVRFEVSPAKDGDSNLFFQVVDKESGKVIRQFPPEKLVELAEADQATSRRLGQLLRAEA
ncbi:MAG: flagellar protein FlaG [Bdellovibrionales bacterium]|nr:flagellar protein FlaG [Bdellovibrionales bacterium]